MCQNMNGNRSETKPGRAARAHDSNILGERMPEEKVSPEVQQRLRELYEQLPQNTRYSAPPASEENQWISGVEDREFDGVLLERVPTWTRKTAYEEWARLRGLEAKKMNAATDS